MFDDLLVTAFLGGILLFWLGALLLWRRSKVISEGPPGDVPETGRTDRAQFNEFGHVPPDGRLIVGVCLLIVGYLFVCYVLLFWNLVFGIAAVVIGFVLVPAGWAWRTR